VIEEREVPDHAEEREERQRDQLSRLFARDLAHQLEQSNVRDPVELGPELQRRQRIEERRLRDLAMGHRQRCVEEPEGDAREPRHAAGHLEQVRERVAQEKQRLLGRVLRLRPANET
jgi:hypothetical protein